MGAKQKKRSSSGLSANAEAVINASGWRVSIFNDGRHLRINGVVDVWPTRRRWLPTHRGPGMFAENYRDIAHLRTIVSAHESIADSKKARAAKWFAGLPEGGQDKTQANGISTWEEFERKFGGKPGETPKIQPRLFETQKKEPELKPLRPFVDDGRPPWE